jgi:hypothetical protein
MKVTIDGHEFPAVPVSQWSYEEADEVKRVTGCTVGQIPIGVLQGDAMASLAFAVVGFLRTRPGEDPAQLRNKPIDSILVDFSDLEAGKRPPAGRGSAAAARSRRKN